MSTPAAFQLPATVLAAAEEADSAWAGTHPYVDEARRRANTHSRYWSSNGSRDATSLDCAQRLIAWGCAIRAELPIPRIIRLFDDPERISVPLEIVSQELAIEPLPDPLDTPGGKLKVALALDLNRRRGVFLLKTWFDGCLLVPSSKVVGVPRDMTSVHDQHDLAAHMHPSMLQAIDTLKDAGQYWDRLAYTLRHLPDALKDM